MEKYIDGEIVQDVDFSEYLHSIFDGGFYCPRCADEDWIDNELVNMMGNTVDVQYTCGSCGFVWEITFEAKSAKKVSDCAEGMEDEYQHYKYMNSIADENGNMYQDPFDK